MANTDKEPSGLLQTIETEVKSPTVERLAGGGEDLREGKSTEPAIVAPIVEKPASTASSTSTSTAVRPSLVQLGSGTAPHSAAQPKRFSAVNINKKFLEKNSSASASSPISQPTSKVGGPSALVRPQTQPTSSHSRLVTAKLTSTSPASSASGAGWSRPSSVAPQNASGPHSPNNNSPPLPASSLSTIHSTTGAPQLPHTGKVIQPQPRNISVLPGLQKDSAGPSKPVWGNLKPTSTPKALDVRNDFPTAAEVAQVTSSIRAQKLNESREAAESAAASKQARMEEADTFRGVHLDPNAHHWDEMEEDDDNFLDSIIEFGDGRQYKIDNNDTELPLFSSNDSRHTITSRPENVSPSKEPAPDLPVSKEERFADDFDRSWPRSRMSPANSRDVSLPSSHSGISHPPPLSPVTSQDVHVQQEASRVLFNERSNRLEPYSNGQRSTSGQFASKRGNNWHDSSSPTEPRSARDFPPTPKSPNIQLLQKPGDQQPRFRRYSGTSTAGGSGGLGSHNRDRDQLSRRDGPPSPRLVKDSFGPSGRDRELHGERGRRSHMGPPPIPPHALRGPSRDSGRQLPPHMSQIPTSAPTRYQERRPSRGTYSPPHEGSNEPSVRLPSQSPVLSQASATRVSPVVSLTSLPLSATEMDEARKDVMQSAAARAKQRRQHEEEEREKEKERARRKAAEIEERIKAAEGEKSVLREKAHTEKVTNRQEDAIVIIEEAVKSAQAPTESTDGTSTVFPSRKLRPLGGLSISPSSAAPASGNSSTLQPSTPSSALQSESWRAKATPLPPPPLQSKPHVPVFDTPLHVESLAASSAEEDLEVVDFSDMGKFVGVPDTAESVRSSEAERGERTPTSRSRPVASDFFDEAVPAPTSSSSAIPDAPQPRERELRNDQIPSSSQPWDVVNAALPKPTSPADSTAVAVPPQANNTRILRNQSHYREAAMSALDDAMSRIKGALDGMQTGDGTKDGLLSPSSGPHNSSFNNGYAGPARRANPPRERWMPPALRPRNFDHESQEVFHITGMEPPRSPKPTSNSFTIKLPSVTPLPLEPIARRQLQAATKPMYQVRMDILSFDPPVEDMKKDLSINEILFRRPMGGFRANPRYRVHLPRSKARLRAGVVGQPLTPKTNGTGAFGRPSEADGLSTWRKPVETKTKLSDSSSSAIELTDAPLEASDPHTISTSESPSTSVKPDALTVARPRVPKMPAGSAVAFYRDSRIDAVEEDPHTSVNFIVGSELETKQTPQPGTPPNIPITSPDAIRTPNKSVINGVKPQAETPPSLVPSKADSKSSDDSNDRVPMTPPTNHATSWAITSLPLPVKESPARGPDPEHLRAVWSQTSNKAGIHGVNSLEGIADDLTALPFTLQDVKSEDGETPPPVSAPPSRMSLHDVTRAFQQVPSSSSNPSPAHRTPPLVAPPARSSNYAYGLPPPPAGTMRPGYQYPPPIMSPSPGLMYPPMIPGSPAPGRMPMNGHAPLYGRPMWMPIPAGSAPQSHANMMQPIASPYPAHMIPYSAGPPLYGPQPPTSMQTTTQSNGTQVNRDRNVPMMSPVLPPAGPSMYGSPVMVHAHPAVPASHGYLMPPGRGQVRVDNGQIPHTSQPSHSGYTSSTFRPTSTW